MFGAIIIKPFTSHEKLKQVIIFSCSQAELIATLALYISSIFAINLGENND